MKKMLALAVLLVAAMPMMAQKVKYSVKGTSPEDGVKVYLMQDGLHRVCLDSTEVKNGQFAFQGEQDKEVLLSVSRQGSDWSVMFFNDGTPVVIDLEKNTLKGSALNEKMTAYDLETAAAKTKDEARAVYRKIFKENRDNIIPAAFFMGFLNFAEVEDVIEVFDDSYAYMSHPIIAPVKQQLGTQIAMMKAKQAMIGQQFTDLEEPDVDGNLHKLSEYVGKGRWVLVDFWASWCGPCRAEMPNVVVNYEKYHEKGFDIVGLSFDQKKEPWVKAIADLRMPWIHLSDLKGWNTVASSVYNIRSIPASLLVDPTGKIVAVDLRGEQLGNKLKEVFGE